jgi:hypothetical protein
MKNSNSYQSFPIRFGGLLILILLALTFVFAGLINKYSPEKFFGVVSALVVLASYPIYGIRVWQRKIVPNISSWIIFTIIAVALFLTYRSSGAKENGWTTLGPLVGTTSILIIALSRSKERKMVRTDRVCLIIGSLTIVAWFLTKQDRNLVQYALYLGIMADFIGIVPSAIFLKKHPEKDRPAMWMIFSFGYFLSMFAITEHTFANWSLPVFMTFAPALVWVSLVKYRIKNKIPVKEWI